MEAATVPPCTTSVPVPENPTTRSAGPLSSRPPALTTMVPEAPAVVPISTPA